MSSRFWHPSTDNLDPWQKFHGNSVTARLEGDLIGFGPLILTRAQRDALPHLHVRDWLTASNFAKQLKALRFKTPYEAINEL